MKSQCLKKNHNARDKAQNKLLISGLGKKRKQGKTQLFNVWILTILIHYHGTINSCKMSFEIFPNWAASFEFCQRYYSQPCKAYIS